MKQSAAERPDPTIQRKAAIINGGVVDHAGRVRIEPMRNFDINRTIFQTLEGAIPRFVMTKRIAKDVHFDADAARRIQEQYEAARSSVDLPTVDPELIQFLIRECNFDVEHAEGSFLDHLYFGFEYSVQHYPAHSPIVMLLHSILGTGTNTFAMDASKIPQLRELITEFEWRHVEAFPSILRLLYDGALRSELHANAHRADAIKAVHFHRVIDNAPITMSGEDLWIQLNYQIMHVIDFLPAANWAAHHSDNSFVLFRDLYALMTKAGKLEATVNYTPSEGGRTFEGEAFDLGTRLLSLVPDSVVDRMAARSVRKFSERIGHSLEYRIEWA
mgnify:CR=1 FL=1